MCHRDWTEYLILDMCMYTTIYSTDSSTSLDLIQEYVNIMLPIVSTSLCLWLSLFIVNTVCVNWMCWFNMPSCCVSLRMANYCRNTQKSSRVRMIYNVI